MCECLIACVCADSSPLSKHGSSQKVSTMVHAPKIVPRLESIIVLYCTVVSIGTNLCFFTLFCIKTDSIIMLFDLIQPLL